MSGMKVTPCPDEHPAQHAVPRTRKQSHHARWSLPTVAKNSANNKTTTAASSAWPS